VGGGVEQKFEIIFENNLRGKEEMTSRIIVSDRATAEGRQVYNPDN
jgi:hypothetical protein